MARAMTGATRKANARVRAVRPPTSKASSPRVNLARAATPGVRIGQANSRRSASARTPMVPTPSSTRNSPKSPGRPSRGINLNTKAGKVSAV